MSFWTKFTQKRHFQSKTEQAVLGPQGFAFSVVNFNSIVVFEHFEKEIGYLLPPGLFILKLYRAFETTLCK